ncbi:methyltransferase domain-containing protein [Streptomyces sp. ODS28]|uniref:methyltransferase domain-containing protein n=1 Tax=Streptomyces sp. ODS28 TaxID=3136688 RepID=UPI0031EBD8F7
MGAADLVRELVARGALTEPAWREAFAAVPRELFVPYYYAAGAGGGQERLWREDADPRRRERWREGVYEDVPLATRLRDGELLSSSSQPSLMARMLEALQVREGMRVLEIGTGSGYNAALLAHRLGDERVTTVDLEPEITEAARRHLAEAGRRPRVVTGNGELGCPAHAPYDRIIATCALTSVPHGWLPQCTPGALAVLPVATGLLSLRVSGAAGAEGNFLSTPAFFVPLRGAVTADVGDAEDNGDDPGGAESGAASEPAEDSGTPSEAGPGPRTGPRPGSPGARTWVPADARRDDSFRFLLALSGGRLGTREAYALWREAGKPSRERYGVTVRDGAQWAWLDEPDGEHTWPLG